MQILSQTEVWRWSDGCIIITSIAGALVLIFLILAIIVNKTDDKACAIYAYLMCLSLAITIITLTAGLEYNHLYHIDYKILLSDDYSAKEFFDKYELLDIDGDIYEIREYIGENKSNEMQGN